MNEIETIFKNFENRKEDPVQLFNQYQEGTLTQDQKQSIFTLFDYIRKGIKNNTSDMNQLLSHYIHDSDAVKKIIQAVRKTLVYYFHLSPLRENKNESIAKMFFKDAFDCYIVRLDPEFASHYADYGFETAAAFKEALVSLDTLCDYYLVSTLTARSITADFKQETELSSDVCECFTECFEKNLNALKQNYIISRLNKLEKMIKQ